MTEFIAMLGLKLQTVVAGGLGSLISLRFIPGLATVTEKVLTCLSGWVLAAYLAEPFSSFLTADGGKTEIGMALFIGLFGMSLTAKIVQVIRETEWSSIIKSKFGGGQ